MKKKRDKLKEMVEMANISEEKVKKLNFKDRQRHYEAKSKLGKVFHDSKRLGTYIKPKNKEK